MCIKKIDKVKCKLHEAPCTISHHLSRGFCYTLCSPAATVYAPSGELPYKPTTPGVNRAEAISPDVVMFSDNVFR